MEKLTNRGVEYDLEFSNGQLIVITNQDGAPITATEYSPSRREWLDVTAIVKRDLAHWQPMLLEELAARKERSKKLWDSIHNISKAGVG